jgi:hypothetical protein
MQAGGMRSERAGRGTPGGRTAARYGEAAYFFGSAFEP